MNIRYQIELYMLIPETTFKPMPIAKQWQDECIKTLNESGHWMFSNLPKEQNVK